ncbi:hypothetical protein EDB19DRAFT_1339596 [Suillus lakei]|nr:hypothetical protein EDB19DRAFT_1339596 [Suillus lakei]
MIGGPWLLDDCALLATMSIPVPLFSLSRIRQPQPPSDPPTNQDVIDAAHLLEYVKKRYHSFAFMRRLRGDNPATAEDLANAQWYLNKVRSAAFAVPGAKVEHCAASDLEHIHTRLDRMNATLVRMMDDSRIQRLGQRLDSDSIGRRLQHMEQRLGHPEQSLIENTHSLCNRDDPLDDTPLYRPIPIWSGRVAQNPEHFGLPPLRTNNDFEKLTDLQLAKYLHFYKVEVDNSSSREMKILRLRCFVSSFSVSLTAT